ncbi:MAG: site-specific DNA-methyltransferase [Opitutaceae bacterium]|nr:site-specific DNA-methyltransferase [Opitutaceae bacterium]
MSAQKPIKAFKHKHATRAAIPSHEEAGAEAASPKVAQGPTTASYPKNPVVHRGQDPELFWLNKYGASDAEDKLPVDIRSLYRHEHIQPEMLLPSLMRVVKTEADQGDLFGSGDFFTQVFGRGDELTKPGEYYYKHKEWTNRLIQGDSLLVMSSLLEREGMAGQVQCIYIDPPYGIKYGSNWQIRLNNRTMRDGQPDEDLSGEPEQIKAFRDTWELGIHSYLSYLRDRLLVAKELLHASGSCFVQISDENVHLVRCLMDEVFGSENFVSQIFFQTTSGFDTKTLATLGDYIIWYARDKTQLKCRKLYEEQPAVLGDGNSKWLLLPDGTYRGVTAEERRGEKKLPPGARLYSPGDLQSQGPARVPQPFTFQGKTYLPSTNAHWKANYPKGMERLATAGRIHVAANSIRYRRFADDFPFTERGNNWTDTLTGSFTADKLYVVWTSRKVIERCILMTTDPGDLVLDPTCGSGTTAYAAEQWGRRWITIDTSRIAISIAKQRILTASLPYYRLYDQATCDIRQGFIYREEIKTTLESIANDEPKKPIKFYDQPEVDTKRLRIAGPFTVETLQNFEPVSPAALAAARKSDAEMGKFEDVVFEHLKSAGVKTGDKKENAVFHRVDRLADADLHAEGFYNTAEGEAKAYLHIGPKFGTVSKQAVNNATKACRRRGDADWLIILGFSFESDIESKSVTTSQGQFQVSKVRMHDDLLQEGLLKRDKKAASFVTIGEPDIALHLSRSSRRKEADSLVTSAATDQTATVEIKGLDIYDPIKDEVKSRDVHDINYWMVDTDYDGANFIVRQAFFCGGDKDEFEEWKKGLSNLALLGAKKKAEKTLKIEINEEAFARLYGHVSHPFLVNPGQQIAVRVISQFGEETTKILEVK